VITNIIYINVVEVSQVQTCEEHMGKFRRHLGDILCCLSPELSSEKVARLLHVGREIETHENALWLGLAECHCSGMRKNKSDQSHLKLFYLLLGFV
jgi:hypothetical protein